MASQIQTTVGEVTQAAYLTAERCENEENVARQEYEETLKAYLAQSWWYRFWHERPRAWDYGVGDWARAARKAREIGDVMLGLPLDNIVMLDFSDARVINLATAGEPS